MEKTIISPEYQKLIVKLDEFNNELNGKYDNYKSDTLYQVIDALEKLGSRPILSGNAQKFMDITNQMIKTYVAKNHDYGNSFDKSLDEFGVDASLVRMNDKTNRLKTLSKNESKVKDESMKDTLLDLANYCIMTYMWLTNKELN